MLLSSITVLVVPQHQLGEELLSEDTAYFVLLQKQHVYFQGAGVEVFGFGCCCFSFFKQKNGGRMRNLNFKSLCELWLHTVYCATFIKCAVLQCRRRYVESQCFHLCCCNLASSAELWRQTSRRTQPGLVISSGHWERAAYLPCHVSFLLLHSCKISAV